MSVQYYYRDSRRRGHCNVNIETVGDVSVILTFTSSLQSITNYSSIYS